MYDNVFFLSNCVHGWTNEDSEIPVQVETDNHIYCSDEHLTNVEELDIALKTAADAGERIEKVHRLLAGNYAKNGFVIDDNEY